MRRSAAVFRANQDVDVVWRERVSWLLDVNHAITMSPSETFLRKATGSSRGSGMANFYLHRPLASNVHRLIAWIARYDVPGRGSPIFVARRL